MATFLHSQNKYVRFIKFVMVALILMSVFPRMFVGKDAIGWSRLTYYTIQTNLIMAAYWFSAASKPARNSAKSFEIFRLMSTTAIVVTGSLYFIFLHADYIADLKGQYHSGQISTFIYNLDMFDTWVNHFTVPILALADFLIIRPHARIGKRYVFSALAIPFAYFIYHCLNGLISGVYLYSFLDPVKLGGWLQVFEIFIILAAFILIMSFVLFILSQKKAHPDNRIQQL